MKSYSIHRMYRFPFASLVATMFAAGCGTSSGGSGGTSGPASAP